MIGRSTIGVLIATAAFLAPCCGNAWAVNLAICIGVRETGTTVAIGGDGGVNNGIEWINLDGLTLPLDGDYHTFTFTFGTDPVTAFAGSTANGVLTGTRGTLENLRIRNIDGLTVPIQLHIDNIRNVTQQGTFTVSDFEGFPVGAEVTFQEPRFSGSTSANLALTPNIAAVTTNFPSQGTQSNGVQFRFIDPDPTRWLRLTTNAATNLPNPAIDFAPGSTLSLDIRGVAVPEPASMLLVGIGSIACAVSRPRRCRRAVEGCRFLSVPVGATSWG